MKTLNTSLWVLLLLMLAISCRNDDLGPIITFDTAIKGAYVRLIDETPRELDLAAPGIAQYEYTIEFVDFERGRLIDQYDIYASFEDNNHDNGDASAGPVLVRTYAMPDFTMSEGGNVRLSVTLTLEELSSLLGVIVEDIQALDRFNIESRIMTIDGKAFMASNSSATINGSSFMGHFRFSLKATCPLPNDRFVGEYKLNYIKDCGHFGCSIEELFVVLEPVADASTQRKFNVRFLEVFGGWDVLIKINFLCDEVVLLTTDTGIGCGDNIMLRPGEPQPIDISDPDAVIEFEYIEDTGDCMAGKPKWIVQLIPV